MILNLTNNTANLKMANGEAVRIELSLIGVTANLIKTVESPSAYSYFFSITNPAQIKGLKTACEVLTYRLKTRVVSTPTEDMDSDFCLIVEKPQADFIKWQTFKAYLKKPYDCLLGIDLENNPVIFNFTQYPHLLIAGASGAGKSVALHTIINSLMNGKNITPNNLELNFIDTKQAEFMKYKNSKFIGCDVATTTREALELLRKGVILMKQRYSVMAQKGLTQSKDRPVFIIIDELADLMMQGKKIIEPLIVSIAQQGRAANIHLIVATQRPTVDVCTGHIKANLPARLALMTASARDSMNIIDRKGAETLKGKGDALLRLPSESQLKRLQVFYN